MKHHRPYTQTMPKRHSKNSISTKPTLLVGIGTKPNAHSIIQEINYKYMS